MTRDFYAIFARVGVWGTEYSDENFIDSLSLYPF